MYIRIFHGRGKGEVLINLAHVWKIEVEYAVRGELEKNDYWHVSNETGFSDENSVRIYKLFVREENFTILSDENDPVTKAINEIYQKAIKS